MPRIVEEQRPLVADNLELIPGGERQPGVEVGQHVVGEAHRRGEGDVDSVATGRLLGTDAPWLSAEQSRAADAVAADVHQRSAVEGRAQAHVPRVAGDEAERRPDHPDAADGPVRDELGEAPCLRIVAVHERLHQQTTCALRRRRMLD